MSEKGTLLYVSRRERRALKHRNSASIVDAVPGTRFRRSRRNFVARRRAVRPMALVDGVLFEVQMLRVLPVSDVKFVQFVPGADAIVMHGSVAQGGLIVVETYRR